MENTTPIRFQATTDYATSIASRGFVKYWLGYFARLKQFIKHERCRRIARKNGATIGQDVVLPLALAKKCNSNLIIGNNSSIQSSSIDLRSPVTIGNNVIIGSDVEIITTSHNIDSPYWEHKYYGIKICDYAWLSTGVKVLPSCQYIGEGAVIGGFSILTKTVDSMSVMSGNPATEIKKRKNIHSRLCVESLLSGDWNRYRKSRNRNKAINE